MCSGRLSRCFPIPVALLIPTTRVLCMMPAAFVRPCAPPQMPFMGIWIRSRLIGWFATMTHWRVSLDCHDAQPGRATVLPCPPNAFSFCADRYGDHPLEDVAHTQFSCRDSSRILEHTYIGTGEPAGAGAEGATAPETLRPKGPLRYDRTLEKPHQRRGAEGIAISGKRTEGASWRF